MTGFVGSLVVTLVLVALAVLTGSKGRRRAHLASVVSTVGSLVVTIVLAVRMGRGYDLEAAGRITPVHLTLARVASLALLAAIVGGILTWRNPRRRPLHQSLVFLALALTVLALVTGTWMVLAAEPI